MVGRVFGTAGAHISPVREFSVPEVPIPPPTTSTSSFVTDDSGGGELLESVSLTVVERVVHVERGDILTELLGRRRAEQDTRQPWVPEREGERNAGGRDIPLARQVDHRSSTLLAGRCCRALVIAGATGTSGEVLAGKGATGEHIRGDETDVGVGQHRFHRRIADPVGPNQAVRQLRRGRQRHTERSGSRLPR